jgi:hypothetical protein
VWPWNLLLFILISLPVTQFESLFVKQLVRKTKTVTQDLNPMWNQEFIFQEVGGGEYLKIKCYDADRFGDENLGSARVNLQGLVEGQVKDVWVPLEKIKQGEIHLRIEVLGRDGDWDCLQVMHCFDYFPGLLWIVHSVGKYLLGKTGTLACTICQSFSFCCAIFVLFKLLV